MKNFVAFLEIAVFVYSCSPRASQVSETTQQETTAPAMTPAPGEIGAGGEGVAVMQAPDHILADFREANPGVTGDHWRRMEDGGYEGTYLQNNRQYTTVYGHDGQHRETRSRVEMTGIPQSVQDAYRRGGHGNASGIYEIRTHDNQTLYRFDVGHDDHSHSFYYNQGGSRVNR